MLSFPTNPSNGQQYTDLNGKVWEFDQVKWNIQSSNSSKEFSGTKIYLIEPFFLNNTLTPVSFDGEEIDTANYFNLLSPTQITIPRTGYYRIHLSLFTGQEGYGASYAVQLKRNNTNLLDTNMSAYQSGVYDEVILLDVGDTISVYAAELNGIGTIQTDSFLEVSLQGYTFGGAIVPGFEFSGVKTELQSNVSTTLTPTAISWNVNDIVFNINANAAGNLYWTQTNPTRFTVSTSGYYRIRAFFLTNSEGSSDSYTITLRKNGVSIIENATLGANESIELDETYEFISNDYIEIVISNTEAIGAIKQDESFFQLIRLGV